MLATLYPTTSPQASQTINLVDNLRDDLIPQAEHGTSLVVHVGGVTATNIDFSHVLTDKLPLFIAVVVLLAFLLLMTVFRSLLIPLVASVMNLLSVGAALGALNAVFNWGWGSSVLGLSGTGPIDAFIPVLMFSVLFGLSMDYEVYLVSRIQEEWHHLHHTQASKLDRPQRPGGPAQPPGGHHRPGQERPDHRGRGQHHDPGLRVVPARRPAGPPGVRLRRSGSPSSSTPWSSAACWCPPSCTSSARPTGPCPAGWTASCPAWPSRPGMRPQQPDPVRAPLTARALA